MKLKRWNKRGQFESKLLAIILIVIIGIILFFMNHLNDTLYTSLDGYFNDSEDFNESTARTALQDIQEVENSVWDYAFLAIFIGFIIQLLMLSFASKINVALYWVMVLLDIPILIVGVILSNIWQEIAANGTFAVTITRFPIMNTILGTYYPTAVLVVLFLAMVVLFGKPQDSNVEGFG